MRSLLLKRMRLLRSSWKTFGAGVVVIALFGIAALALSFSFGSSRPTSFSPTANVLHVVAAENFWGSLVAQIGGSHVQVTSIVTDPNVDPHTYESNAQTARAFANADYVVLNGAGYDSWGEKLLGGNPSSHRVVLDVATLLGKKQGDNPHFWYDPAYVNQVASRMEHDLIALDPSNASYYEQQYQALRSALLPYQNRIVSIRQHFAGTNVAATEDIFSYFASAAGLNLISPTAFMQAIAEGNDPPSASVVLFQNQLASRQPAVLVYNQQTITPLTARMKKLATTEGISVVGVTETIQPPSASFQDWMNAQVLALQTALAASAPGK